MRLNDDVLLGLDECADGDGPLVRAKAFPREAAARDFHRVYSRDRTLDVRMSERKDVVSDDGVTLPVWLVTVRRRPESQGE